MKRRNEIFRKEIEIVLSPVEAGRQYACGHCHTPLPASSLAYRAFAAIGTEKTLVAIGCCRRHASHAAKKVGY